MKKTFLALAIIFSFAACKKDNKQPSTVIQPLNATGSWALYSNDDTFFTVGKVTADQYPCIANNILTFKSDSTYSSNYTGTSICYVSAVRGNGSTTLGMPGQPPQTGTWRRNGNDIYIGTEHYVISNPNGKLTLNLNSSFTVNGVSYSIAAIFYQP